MVHFKNALKLLVPITIITTSSLPSFIFYWISLRILTIQLPSSYFRSCDDFLYDTFQRQFLLFFQIFSGIKVIFLFLFCLFTLFSLSLSLSFSFMSMEIMKKYSREEKMQF
jgi:hypothetical protein